MPRPTKRPKSCKNAVLAPCQAFWPSWAASRLARRWVATRRGGLATKWSSASTPGITGGGYHNDWLLAAAGHACHHRPQAPPFALHGCAACCRICHEVAVSDVGPGQSHGSACRGGRLRQSLPHEEVVRHCAG